MPKAFGLCFVRAMTTTALAAADALHDCFYIHAPTASDGGACTPFGELDDLQL